jgi:NADH:ubiquinone oxidoreductase subunit 2 (subunit N)
MAKYQVLFLSISKGILLTSIFAIVMAIIGVYYYFFVIREIFTERGQTQTRIEVTWLNAALIIICSVGVLATGIFVWQIPI